MRRTFYIQSRETHRSQRTGKDEHSGQGEGWWEALKAVSTAGARPRRTPLAGTGQGETEPAGQGACVSHKRAAGPHNPRGASVHSVRTDAEQLHLPR